ncbi:hypothetical protein E5288_WYG010974 [Bos mutus]|uniref:Uncharacterized protein n=1 Tax=Bos mutus TaxID=72004 RepID=A0A6B0R125_9CETA|nr:hypothetical protein [Bos mutus]
MPLTSAESSRAEIHSASHTQPPFLPTPEAPSEPFNQRPNRSTFRHLKIPESGELAFCSTKSMWRLSQPACGPQAFHCEKKASLFPSLDEILLRPRSGNITTIWAGFGRVLQGTPDSSPSAEHSDSLVEEKTGRGPERPPGLTAEEGGSGT